MAVITTKTSGSGGVQVLTGTDTAEAAQIDVLDAAGNYTGTTLEAILAEAVGVKVLSQRIQHSDLTAAATSEAIAITGMPANALIVGAYVELDTDFSGGSVASCDVEIGDSIDTDGFLQSQSVFTGVGPGFYSTIPGVRIGGHMGASLSATFTTAADDVVNLDAGDCYIKLYYVPIFAAT